MVRSCVDCKSYDLACPGGTADHQTELDTLLDILLSARLDLGGEMLLAHLRLVSITGIQDGPTAARFEDMVVVIASKD